MNGMSPTDYIRELNNRIESLIRENERLRLTLEMMQAELDKQNAK